MVWIDGTYDMLRVKKAGVDVIQSSSIRRSNRGVVRKRLVTVNVLLGTLLPDRRVTGSNGAIVRGWAMAATVAVCAAQITNSLRHLIYADFTG
jgi:hypothetical protein